MFLHQICMNADNQPETEKPADTQRDVRPLAGKDPKLEDKIADEKDEELAKETATD
jgi:hypothetical protein